jgi:hypothetical protein
MLNAVKSAIGRKLLTALLLAFLLFTSLLFSQNTFRLGYTGSCYDFELRTGDFGLI